MSSCRATNAKPYAAEDFDGPTPDRFLLDPEGADHRRVWATVKALAAAQKRSEELEAQVARHPEQLRRVADALVQRGLRDAYWPRDPDDLAAIIAEALK